MHVYFNVAIILSNFREQHLIEDQKTEIHVAVQQETLYEC